MTTQTKTDINELIGTLIRLRLEATHYLNTGKGKEFLIKAIEEAITLEYNIGSDYTL